MALSEKQTSSSTAESIKDAAREATAKVTSTAKDLTSRATDSAERMASERKSQAADRVAAVGSAVHDTAESLEQQDPNIAWLTHQAADRLDRAADYIRDRDFRQLTQDAENWARNHPVAFFGGMAILGVVIGAAVRTAARASSSSSSSMSSDEQSGYDTGYAGQDLPAAGNYGYGNTPNTPETANAPGASGI